MVIKERNLGHYHVPSYITGNCVDIGANVGTFIELHADSFRAFHYYEAFRDNFKRCEAKSSNLNNVSGFNEAVSSSDGNLIQLLIPNNGDCGSIAVDSNNIEIRNEDWHEETFSEKVQTVSLETIIDRIGGHVDYMKIDCETSEYALFMDKDLSNVDIIAMELHNQLGQKKCSELVDHISKTHKLIPDHSYCIGWKPQQHQTLYFEAL